MRDSKIGTGLLAIFVMLLLAGIGCTRYEIPGKSDPKPTVNNCEECHTDYDRLVEEHTPEAPPSDTVYGVIPPYYEPYVRVFLGGTGYDSFKESPHHYPVGCTGCHNGDNETADKDLAHSGDFLSHPSMFYEDKCASCHQNITNNFTTSIHNGTGMKRAVTLRSGLSGASEFDELPEHQIDGYNKSCATCHGTCGNCHVVRPYMGGGGLSTGHNFARTPDMSDVCITCHSTKGREFMGLDSGTEPDFHRDSLDNTCLNCHDGVELHGDGNPVEQRYAYSELPTCKDCHDEDKEYAMDLTLNYHSQHVDDFQCQICHSQSYNSCGACHIAEGHAEIEAFMDFKIALNTIPNVKDNKLALVRRTQAHPDNWVGYGEDLVYENFEVLPTFNYTTPHNIIRKTARTDVEEGTACYSNCHIRNEGGTLINSEYYLWRDSLHTWELEATKAYAVDGELPPYWFFK